MPAEDEFTSRLVGFGLSEKEARTYLYLLKYGPKTPSPLAKSLKTYREDAHRTLNSLIEKGMVRPSLDAPTIYAAVDLNEALRSAVKKQESELREMEKRKRELEKLAQLQRFHPPDEISTFKIIKSTKELVAAVVPMIESMQEEWLLVVPGLAAVVASLFGINDAAAAFIQRGGKVRVIVNITYQTIDVVRELLSIGEEVRHIDKHGVMFVVFDRKHSMSAIRIPESASLNAPLTALWTDDSAYATYLAAAWEMLWEHSVPAEQRIQELLRQGPPQS
jgi:sugar-specific transcriptional regulator TrmB